MKIRISEGTVTLRLAPYEVPLGFKTKLEIPVSCITSAEATPRSEVPHGSLIRAPGAHVPGLVRFGSYGRKPNRQFWAVFRQDPVLVIDIEGWEYERLVVGMPDAAQTAGTIQMAIA